MVTSVKSDGFFFVKYVATELAYPRIKYGLQRLRVHFLGKSENRSLNPKTDFAIFFRKIQSIHTRGGYFELNLNPDFLDSSLQRFFGKGFEKSTFDKRFSMQKLYTTATLRDSLAQTFFSPHFYRTIEDMNRSKIARFLVNFTPEITIKFS